MVVSVILVGTSLVLLLFGVAIATDSGGLAQRVARFAGAGETGAGSPRPATDRYWSVMPLAYGSAVLLSVVLRQSGRLGPILELLAVVAYFGATLRLAWIYSPPAERRRFVVTRPAVLPIAAFVGVSAILVLVLGIVKRLAQ